jgi:hypothetical protein
MPRNFDNLDPTLLADLDQEAEYAKSTQRRRFMPRIKLERGESMMIRLLPVEIGANKSWMGRFGQHWVHKRAVFCKKVTSPHLGGDPHHDCKACKLVANGMTHSNKAYKDRATECFAEPIWFAVAIPIAKIGVGKSKPVAIPEPDCWVAHEFLMYRTMFDQIRMIAGQFAVKGTKGITDLEHGQDIWIARTGRGFTANPAGATPIWGENCQDPQSVINAIWSSIIPPNIEIPDVETENEVYFKIKEYITTGGGNWDNQRGGRGRNNNAPAQDNLDDEAAPQQTSNRFSRGNIAPPSTAEEDPSLDPALNEGLGEELEPPTPAARPAPATAAPSAPPVAPQPPNSPPAAPPAATKTKLVQPPVPRVAAAPPVIAPPLAAVAPPTPAPQTAVTTPQITAQGPEEEEDAGVAREAVDTAPPIVDTSLSGTPPSAVTAPPPAAPQITAPPAAVPTTPPPAAGIAPPVVKARGTRLGSALTSRLSNFQQPG